MTRISERRPQDLKESWNFREDLSIENGVIFLWAALRNSHVSTEKCLLKAKESLIWPGISRDIKELAANCATCMQSSKQETVGVPLSLAEAWMWFGSQYFTLQAKLSKIRTRYKVKLAAVPSVFDSLVQQSGSERPWKIHFEVRKYRKSGWTAMPA